MIVIGDWGMIFYNMGVPSFAMQGKETYGTGATRFYPYPYPYPYPYALLAAHTALTYR